MNVMWLGPPIAITDQAKAVSASSICLSDELLTTDARTMS